MAGWRSFITLLLISVSAFVSGLAEEVLFALSVDSFFLQIFQASEVEEEEAEVPEESFTSTKEFKVKKALRTFWDVGML